MDGGRASDITFENVKVPASAVIGKVDGGFALLDEALDYGTAAVCAEAVGAMKAATQGTIEYTRTRKQFGQPIGQFQVLQHRMVDMMGEGEHATSITYMAHMKIVLGEDERRMARVAAKSISARPAALSGSMPFIFVAAWA